MFGENYWIKKIQSCDFRNKLVSFFMSVNIVCAFLCLFCGQGFWFLTTCGEKKKHLMLSNYAANCASGLLFSRINLTSRITETSRTADRHSSTMRHELTTQHEFHLVVIPAGHRDTILNDADLRCRNIVRSQTVRMTPGAAATGRASTSKLSVYFKKCFS